MSITKSRCRELYPDLPYSQSKVRAFMDAIEIRDSSPAVARVMAWIESYAQTGDESTMDALCEDIMEMCK